MVDITALLKAEIAAQAETSTTISLAGTEVKLFSLPITAADLRRISRNHPNFLLQPSMEGMVDLIVLKAMDENGQPAFTLEHKPMLMRLPSRVITSIYGELFGEQLAAEGEEEQDSRKGKSKAIT